MGGPAMPGIGWAAGVERLAMLIDEPPGPSRTVVLVPLGEAADRVALKVGEELRNAGLAVELTHSGHLPRPLRGADRLCGPPPVPIGDQQLAPGAPPLPASPTGEPSLGPPAQL